MLMVPPNYVEELKTAPIDEIDFVATFFEVNDEDAVGTKYVLS